MHQRKIILTFPNEVPYSLLLKQPINIFHKDGNLSTILIILLKFSKNVTLTEHRAQSGGWYVSGTSLLFWYPCSQQYLWTTPIYIIGTHFS